MFGSTKLPIKYSEASPQFRRLAREAYQVIQENKCFHCKEFLSEPPSKEIQEAVINKTLFPNGFFNYPVHLHHDHETDYTIGAVHARCNAYLWQYHGE